MRIAYVLPGSGDTFYCQNCVRDITLVRALRKRGHDVVLVPLYLPLFVDDEELADDAPIFFGGLSAYLQQEYAFFRKTPRWIDRILDAKPLLRRLARRSGSTQAYELGEMTISMLLGEDGNQSKEVHRLTDWLKESVKPDLVHLSTALLLGMVPALRRDLDAKIVCSLQDEDIWVDSMKEDDAKEVWRLMAKHGQDADAFVAVSRYYADAMSGKMLVPPEKMHIVYPGIPFEEYSVAPKPPDVPTLGYLSKLTVSLGIEMLIEAFLLLKKKPGLGTLRLKVTGGRTKEDRQAAQLAKDRIAAAGCADSIEFVWNFDRASRIDFLKSLSVLSVPSEQGEAFGLHIIEAMACGVPVVQPRAGAYPELVEGTHGGVLCDAGSVKSLVSALESLLLKPDEARKMGERGRESVGRMFSTDAVVKSMLEVYDTFKI